MATTDYRKIYDHIYQTDSRYLLAEYSPGLRCAIQSTAELQMLSGRALDIGCGSGFVVEYLSLPSFDFQAYGIDISSAAIELAHQRLAHLPAVQQRLSLLTSQTLPFENEFFRLVTCFDVLEHLDEIDIDHTIAEVRRVLQPGGLFLAAVSCRPAGITDLHGDNLHRSVCSVDWWLNRLAPERAEYDGHRKQLKLWVRK